jgi:hypothetical protein
MLCITESDHEMGSGEDRTLCRPSDPFGKTEGEFDPSCFPKRKAGLAMATRALSPQKLQEIRDLASHCLSPKTTPSPQTITPDYPLANLRDPLANLDPLTCTSDNQPVTDGLAWRRVIP